MFPYVGIEHILVLIFFYFGKLLCHCAYRALSMLTQLGHLIAVLEFNYKPACLGIM